MAESLLPEPLRNQLRSQLAQVDQERQEKLEALGKLDARRNAIAAMLVAYGDEDLRSKETPEKSGMCSLDMARIVLLNAGRPLAINEIFHRIRETYGMPAAKTLPDMLWKRARAGNIFFKASDGKIGLLQLQPQVQTVAHHSSEAVA